MRLILAVCAATTFSYIRSDRYDSTIDLRNKSKFLFSRKALRNASTSGEPSQSSLPSKFGKPSGAEY